MRGCKTKAVGVKIPLRHSSVEEQQFCLFAEVRFLLV